MNEVLFSRFYLKELKFHIFFWDYPIVNPQVQYYSISKKVLVVNPSSTKSQGYIKVYNSSNNTSIMESHLSFYFGF